ncbi:TM1266 family iron-only hydrogenase system putative regulator [Fuchsiella alkaliacetigena]|uniref:TM1266 family iron-only hydrogenase system putative regulator n=1 Tax=Fuchsiella alkaliacetigena TaxID=957042 RepID=UPI00200A5027|nr:TM1266 family iron-only hydrogenase system putative regulator [Fuchsiella alkaliacetigena]MCK8825756.1 iron-only hydrogenase system regulator [Fuchsiella alkaliacetigena]
MNKRIGVIGIIVEDREQTAEEINQVLSEHAEIIIGRMGIPSPELELSLISLMIEGTSDQVGALTGKLGNLSGVKLKTALISK